MEKRGRFSDELALTKSAAWAWLEHRSGTDGGPTSNFNISRKNFDSAPSRYKAEAMKKGQENFNPIHSNGCDCSLLDRYDIERISKQLDHYIEYSRSSRLHGNIADGSARGGRREEATVEKIKSKNIGVLKKVMKGMWLGSNVPLACGSSRGEVAVAVAMERKSFDYSRRRRSSESSRAVATVAEVVGCRSRQGIRA